MFTARWFAILALAFSVGFLVAGYYVDSVLVMFLGGVLATRTVYHFNMGRFAA